MAIVYEAPEICREKSKDDISVFLAGGITGCCDWQSIVADKLSDCRNLLIFNPRRKDFDVTDPTASRKQIEWEFEQLNDMDIFSMYFVNSDSVQPICMYELGRHLERMKNRFPDDWQKRIVIGIEDGYLRKQDVIIQSELALGGVYYRENSSPTKHADDIRKAISQFY